MDTVKIKWTDPPDILTNEPCPATWAGTVVVRKEGSAPRHRWDGTLIVDSTTRDEYSVTALEDTTVEVGKSYYYGIFPYDTKGYYRFTKVEKVSIKEKPMIPVKFIQSDRSNSQYIDTGFYPSAGSNVEIKFKLVSNHNRYQTVIGCQKTSSSGQYDLGFWSGYNKSILYHSNEWNGSIYGASGNVDCNEWHKHFVNGSTGKYYIDDVLQDSSINATNNSAYPKSFYIFACNDNSNGAVNFSSIQLEYFKIWDYEGNLVRDFIPVLDSQNVACLYDNVTQEYFYNLGSGSFYYENL